MDKPSPLPRGAVKPGSAVGLRELLSDAVPAGYDVDLSGWRPEDIEEDGDPAWRVNFRYAPWTQVGGAHRRSLDGVLAAGLATFNKRCTPPTATGLPSTKKQWKTVGEQVEEIFRKSLKAGLTPSFSVLVAGSQLRYQGWDEREAHFTSVKPVKAGRTAYRLEIDLPRGGGSDEWMLVISDSLTDLTAIAAGALADTLKAANEKYEAQRERSRVWREQRAAATS
jgi:hypothetical protein